MRSNDYTMKTGATFTATDKLGDKYNYEVVGIDLGDILCGTGCSYIVLKNLTKGWITRVEKEWFNERKIENINCWRNSIEMPCASGVLCAESSGDTDYPSIYTWFKRKDGMEIDLCLAQGDGIIPIGVDKKDYDGKKNLDGGVQVCVYADTRSEDWTDDFKFSKEELEAEIE